MITYTYEGITYRSRLALSRKFDIPYDLLKTRLKRGWSLKKAIQTPVRKNNKNTITVDGVTYDSIVSACKKYGIREGKVRVRLSQKWTVDEAFGLVKRKYHNRATRGYVYIIRNKQNKKVYVGITTTSLKQRLKEHINSAKTKANPNKFQRAILSIGYSKFYIEKLKTAKVRSLCKWEKFYINEYKSVTKGYNTLSSGDVLGKYGKEIMYEGDVYNISELSRKFNMSREKIEYRLKNNLPFVPKHVTHISVKIKGKIYKSLAELARAFNINHRTITLRYEKGLRGNNLVIVGRLSSSKIKELIASQQVD